MSDQADIPYGTRPKVDPVRIWAGGVATALVAGGVAWVGLLVIRAVFQIPGIHRLGQDNLDVDRLSMAVWAAVSALLATAVLHLLMIGTPRAHRFFSWIVGLFVVGLIVEKLLAGTGWLTGVLISALYLIIGIAIASLLTGVARTAVKYVPDRPKQRPVETGPQYKPRDQSYPKQDYNNRDYDSQDFNQNYNQDYNNQNYPNQGYENQGYDNEDYPTQSYPSQGYPSQGYPSQGYPSQGEDETHRLPPYQS